MSQKGLSKIKEREKQMMEKFGFVIHFVFGDDGNTPANIHTHGLTKSFDHPDLQCVVHLPSETAYAIFHNIVNQIRGGRKFKPGDIVPDILNNYNITFIWATEGEKDRVVLRMILPDKDGNLAPEKIQGKLAMQYLNSMLQ